MKREERRGWGGVRVRERERERGGDWYERDWERREKRGGGRGGGRVRGTEVVIDKRDWQRRGVMMKGETDRGGGGGGRQTD